MFTKKKYFEGVIAMSAAMCVVIAIGSPVVSDAQEYDCSQLDSEISELQAELNGDVTGPHSNSSGAVFPPDRGPIYNPDGSYNPPPDWLEPSEPSELPSFERGWRAGRNIGKAELIAEIKRLQEMKRQYCR